MKRLVFHPRAPFVVAAAFSLTLVLGGVLLAKWLNLAACPLCILQRMLYLLLAAFAIAGLAATTTLWRRIAAFFMSVAAGTGAFVAGYQVWIQRFARDTDCVAEMPWWEHMVNWASERVPLLFQVSGLCSEPGWKMLGLSIAEWSLLAFFGLLAVSLFAVSRRH